MSPKLNLFSLPLILLLVGVVNVVGQADIFVTDLMFSFESGFSLKAFLSYFGEDGIDFEDTSKEVSYSLIKTFFIFGCSNTVCYISSLSLLI